MIRTPARATKVGQLISIVVIHLDVGKRVSYKMNNAGRLHHKNRAILTKLRLRTQNC